MPDSFDYNWLGWLMEHPEEWSADDHDRAEHFIADQKRALAEVDPRDGRTRDSMRTVVDGLEAAIAVYRTRGA